MKSALMTCLLVCAMAAPVFADTKNGNANQGSWQRFRFTSLGGETTITFTWTNTQVNLFGQVVCGAGTAAFVTAISGGGFDRVGRMTYGIGAGFQCVIFVTTTGGATSYRMSVRHSVTQDLLDDTATLQLVEDQRKGDYAEALAQQTFDLVRLNTP